MLKEATQEICRALMFLGHSEVTLRRDIEPAMKQLSDSVKLTRTRLGLTTHIEDAPPDVDQGMQVERWVQSTRNLGKTLIATEQQRSGVKIDSTFTLGHFGMRVGCSIDSRPQRRARPLSK